MRYLKLFEGFKSFEDIKDSIMSIFIELQDLGYSVITYISTDNDTISVSITAPTGKMLNESDKEYILMFIDYIKDIWNGKYISVLYNYRVYISEISRKVFTNSKLDFKQFSGPSDRIVIEITKRDIK